MAPTRLRRALLGVLLGVGCLAGGAVPASASPATITISPTTLPDGSVAVAYDLTFTGTGGSGPLTFSTANTVPAGLTLASDGELSGTPTQGGVYPFTVTAVDAMMDTGSVDVTLTIAAPKMVIAPPELGHATAGRLFAQQLQVSGGTAPYAIALSAGSLPDGLDLDSSGLLSGTPATAGASTFTVRATDSSNAMTAHTSPPPQGPFTATRTYTLVVDPGPLSRLELSRTSGALVQGQPSTWHTEGFDAAGDDLGDLSGSAQLSISPDGTCAGATCTPRLGAAHTITVTAGSVSAFGTEAVASVPPDLRSYAVRAGDGVAVVSWDYVVPPLVSSVVTITAHDRAGHVHRYLTASLRGTATLHGLTNGTRWTVVLAIASEAGDSVREIGVVTPGGLPKLSLKTVRHGGLLMLSGRVSTHGTGLAGRLVSVTTTVGHRTVRLTSVRTGTTGVWSATVRVALRTTVTATTKAGTATVRVSRAA